MNNPFPYSDSNKRYHTFNYFLRHHFGCKVAKVSLDAGFTCPNLDGTKGTGGCTYCSSRGSGDFAGDVHLPLDRQFEQVRQMMDHKWEDTLYIPYFQAHTNTYAPLPVLREKFEQALNFPNVAGLAIATRADCISDETADYLGELAQRTYLEVELGLQTIHDVTGQRINRCHSYADFCAAIKAARAWGAGLRPHHRWTARRGPSDDVGNRTRIEPAFAAQHQNPPAARLKRDGDGRTAAAGRVPSARA